MCLRWVIVIPGPCGGDMVYWLPVMFSSWPWVNWAGLLCRRAGVLGRLRIKANLHSSDHSLHNICNALMTLMYFLINKIKKNSDEGLAVDLWRGNHFLFYPHKNTNFWKTGYSKSRIVPTNIESLTWLISYKNPWWPKEQGRTKGPGQVTL